MSTNQPTTTRRRMLQTGGLTAIAAGPLGTTAESVAAQPASLAVAPVSNVDELTAEVLWRVEHLRGLFHAQERTEKALRVTLTPEQSKLFDAYERAQISAEIETWDMYVAELGRHLPGLAPALWAVWLHIAETRHGECCHPAINPPDGIGS